MKTLLPVVLSSWRLFVNLSLLLLISGVLLASASLLAQTPGEHTHHDHAAMSIDEPVTPAQQAKLLADKRESEFNHHLAGFFLVIAGLLLLAQPLFRHRITIAEYALPVCFLLAGLFLLVFSDTELWPFGPEPWIQGTLTDPEVLQHKTFAVLLLILGGVEFARARRRLTATWSAWIFPACALIGAVLLLFHSHGDDMHGPDHMATMERIQLQHFSYSGVGMGIGVSKGLAEVHNKWQPAFAKIYPTLMIVLGVLLMAYVE
jgi:copper resistance protein D